MKYVNLTAEQGELGRRVSEELLPFVEQPGQYIGGEVNQVKKNLARCGVTIALAFPDTYTVGMSHLGLAILYEILNDIDGFAAERVYCPQQDAEGIMRQKHIELFSWESRQPIRDFDILGFSLQYEMCCTNVLTMLDLAGINLHSNQRKQDEPLVIGGGPLAQTPEPLADFFDAFIVGDGEEALPAFARAYRQVRDQKLPRHQMLLELARQFDWLYVPSMYEVQYNADETIKSFGPRVQGVPAKIKRAHVNDLENCPGLAHPLVANTKIIHERVSVEIMRGCPNRCRFCQAAYTRHPLRYRSVEKIVAMAKQAVESSGYDEISLVSLSTSDYPRLAELIERLNQTFAQDHVNISLPSLRVGETLRLLPERISTVRKSGLTIALESANEQIRLAMNKHISNDDLFTGVAQAYKAGWRQIKLYFMAGFDGEGPKDIEEIFELALHLSRLRRNFAKGSAKINVAVSWLVPKPHTPLAWSGQKPADYFHQVRRILRARQGRKHRDVQIKFHNVERSVLEAVLSRADRRIGPVIEWAWRKGARFDAWDEQFDADLWQHGLQACRIDPAFYANRPRDYNEVLPWDHIEAAGPRDTLIAQAKTISSLK